MKGNPTILIAIIVIIAAIATVESRNGEVYNPVPGGLLSNGTTTSSGGITYQPYPTYPNSGGSQNNTGSPQNTAHGSAYTRYIRLSGKVKSEYSSAPGKESITISLSRSAPAPVTITGWQIWSVATGNRAIIPQGTIYPQEKNAGPQVPIILKPGEKAVVYSGPSPLETSFKPNICLAYLTDQKQFPWTIGTRCPDIEEIALPLPFFDRENACENFIERLPSCAEPHNDEDFPDTVNKQCENYIKEFVGYDNCVRLRKNDANFLQNDWLVYLNRPAKMYKNTKEKILLFDEKGLLVDEY